MVCLWPQRKQMAPYVGGVESPARGNVTRTARPQRSGANWEKAGHHEDVAIGLLVGQAVDARSVTAAPCQSSASSLPVVMAATRCITSRTSGWMH